MNGFILEPPVTRWICHLCGARDVTKVAGVHSRMHNCSKLGMTAPMHDETLNIKVEVIEREDYIGQENVQLDNDGRAVMSIKSTRDDGEDVVVYAPTVVKEIL